MWNTKPVAVTLVVACFLLCNASPVVTKFPKLCGKRPPNSGSLIINGQTAYGGQWPWLGIICQGDTTRKCFCASSLITNKHTVTAAHCFFGKGEATASWSNAIVQFGRHDLSNEEEEEKTTTQSRNVHDVVLHPDWNPKSDDYDADIAIIVLNKPVRFNPKVQPICLPQPGDLQTQSGSVVSLISILRNDNIII